MRIAVYVLDAAVTGTTTYAFELAKGLRQLGHEVTTITATRSGRETVRWTRADGGSRWWMQAPDVTVSEKELKDHLDTYDYVIVNDVACSTIDNEKGDRKPPYVVGFLETKTPWTMIAHGNTYDLKHAPHFRYLIEGARSFSGTLLAVAAPYVYDEHEMFHDLQTIPIRLPYTPKFEMDGPLSVRRVAGIAGRFASGKNLHVAGLAAYYTTAPFTDIELWGACQASMRPSDSYLLYEQYAGRDGVRVEMEPTEKNRSTPWAVRFWDERGLSYHGSYTDMKNVMLRFRVFMNLTDIAYTRGTEYSTLEAIDAGCLLLAQPEMLDRGSKFQYGPLRPISIPRLSSSAVKHDVTLREVAGRIDSALSVGEDMRVRLAAYNRQVLRDEHDPKAIARTVFNAF